MSSTWHSDWLKGVHVTHGSPIKSGERLFLEIKLAECKMLHNLALCRKNLPENKINTEVDLPGDGGRQRYSKP